MGRLADGYDLNDPESSMTEADVAVTAPLVNQMYTEEALRFLISWFNRGCSMDAWAEARKHLEFAALRLSSDEEGAPIRPAFEFMLEESRKEKPDLERLQMEWSKFIAFLKT